MLRPERMREVSILVKNRDRDAVIDLLSDAKSLHFIDHKKSTVSKTEVDIDTPKESAAELSEALTLARSLLARLPEEDGTAGRASVSQRIAKIRRLAEQYSRYEQQIVQCENDIDRAEETFELLEYMRPYKDPIPSLFKSKMVEPLLLAGGASSRIDRLEKLSPALFLENKREHSVLLALRKASVDPDGHDARLDIVKNARYRVVDLTPLETMTGTVQKNLQRLRKKIRDTERALYAAEDELDDFARHYTFLEESRKILEFELMKAQAPLHFGATKRVTMIRGFIPEKKFDVFQEKILRIGAVIQDAPAENAPISLKNPPVANSFEGLIHMYTLPKYNEIDPTSLMAITFPIFFGFMLGDIGYGLSILALCGLLWRLAPVVRPALPILILSGISTIGFGVFYGEIFGMEQIFGYAFHPVIHRTHELMTMFGIAACIGLAHINLGLILGMINKIKDHGFVHGFIEKGSWIVLEVGAVLVAANYGAFAGIPVLEGIRLLPWVGWLVLGVAIAGIYYSEGLQGIFELPMIASHTLSYLRLIAIGLASVYLAIVVNELGGGLVKAGGFWIALGILVILVGHIINLGLGLLGPFLHSLRLHYAEFFMKFYSGGGKKYQPFGVQE